MKRKPIPVSIEKDGKRIDFKSLCQCAKYLFCQPGQLTMRPSYKGWKITLHGDRHTRRELQCKVYLFHKTGEYIREFESVAACARYFGFSHPKSMIEHLKKGKYQEYLIRRQKDNPDTFDINDFQ